MTLSMPSLDLPGILLLGAFCFAAGTAVGASAVVSIQQWRKSRAG